MVVYIMCDDHRISDRWMYSLRNIYPILKDNFSLDMEGKAVVFIQDSTFKNLTDEAKKMLFLRRVMVLSMIPNFDEAQYFLSLGSMGYGNGMMHESHILSAYQALEEGNVWLHPDFIATMISQVRNQKSVQDKSLEKLEVLTHREHEVALMLGDGATHQEIAEALDITVRTVKAHAGAIYQKLSVKDRLALSLLLHS